MTTPGWESLTASRDVWTWCQRSLWGMSHSTWFTTPCSASFIPKPVRWIPGWVAGSSAGPSSTWATPSLWSFWHLCSSDSSSPLQRNFCEGRWPATWRCWQAQLGPVERVCLPSFLTFVLICMILVYFCNVFCWYSLYLTSPNFIAGVPSTLAIPKLQSCRHFSGHCLTASGRRPGILPPHGEGLGRPIELCALGAGWARADERHECILDGSAVCPGGHRWAAGPRIALGVWHDLGGMGECF